jgi:bifunctional DNA-binding transcriptional regulator/antitoxin component of YhaV-PrlF toxin-antitoxin module
MFGIYHRMRGKASMTKTIVDQRGRVLIPEAIRESTGLVGGTVATVERERDRIVIKRLRKSKRGWRRLCGLVPKRIGRPEWPTPEEIKSIWLYTETF